MNQDSIRVPDQNGNCSLGDIGGYSDTKIPYPSLAMVYATDQYWGQLYTTDDALMHGTLFECLYLPFDPNCKGEDMR